MPKETGNQEIDTLASIEVSSAQPKKEVPENRVAIDLGSRPLGRSEEDLKQDVASILQTIKLPTREHEQAPQKTEPLRTTPSEDASAVLLAQLAPILNEEAPPAPLPDTTPEPPLPPQGNTSMLSVMPTVDGPVAPQATKKAFNIPSVHTLKDDLQDVVETEKISAVKAAALEAKKRERRDQTHLVQAARGPRSHAVLKTILAAILLILFGIGALLVVSVVKNQRAINEGTTALSSIMFSEQTLSYPIQGKTGVPLRQELSLARTQIQIPLGAITRIASVLPQADGTPRIVSAQEFLSALGAVIPDDLAQSLSPEYFFGVHSLDQNVPVLVLPLTDYEHAFAGMLGWEKSISDDLRPLFTHVPAETLMSDGTLVSRKFEDVIIQNYDVRVLKDATGTVRLLYSFPTRNFLIIAESPNSFVEVLSRLRAERRL
jgi:hypothetical protein